ncbi:MAG: DUF432 domain-containing protein [Bacteroidota bacterium]
MEKNQLFRKLQIEPGDHRIVEMEKFRVAVKRESEGWIFLQLDDTKELKNGEPDFSSGEFYQTGKSNSLLLSPSFPSKPLVFKGSGLFVSPGQKLLFYLKIPLTVQIYFSKNQPEKLLKEILVNPLSNTWFGDPDGGEPAFSLGNEYFLNPDNARPGSYEALCPVSIFNNSAGVLEVERLIIRAENLSLYKNNDKIVTSLISLEYKGKDVVSSASYRFSKNIHGEKPEVIATPRSSVSKNMLKINFHFIKNIYKSE